MAELLLKDEVYAVVGAAIEVHRQLGNGFLESVYQEAMEIELGLRGIPFESKTKLTLQYKQHQLNAWYQSDLICYGTLLVELKALSNTSGTEEAQILNYLKATGLRVGLMINFGQFGRLDWERYVL
jgi:GxxExxY protein